MSSRTHDQPDPEHRRHDAAAEPPSIMVTGGLIGAVFLVNALILGYAIYIARPTAGGSDPPARAVVAAQAGRGPVIPGLHNDHPLSTDQVGDVLMSELNCTGCHADPQARVGAKRGPDLAQAGARIDPAFLTRFIADPAAADPGTTMPDMLGERSAAERASIAADITAFLVDRADGAFARSDGAAEESAGGRELFHTIGCVACHPPRDGQAREIDAAGLVTLSHVPSKYSRPALAAFLFQPLEARPSGRMPDMMVTREEAGAIATWLVGTDAPTSAAAPTAGSVSRGRRHFIDLNCAACHALDGVPAPRMAGALDTLDAQAGCLAGAPAPTDGSSAAPDFHLDEEQRRAIRASLAAPSGPIGDEPHIAMTLTRFNCIACHVRDDYGGVSPARDRFFTSGEPSLGDAARIPPPLTLLGAKLRAEWLQGVLFDAAVVRPYMHVRMPQFGEANLGDFPERVARADRVEPVPFPELDNDAERAHRDAGRVLTGERGLNCIACHGFAGKPSPGFDGIDLLTSVDRLERDWFHHFMRSPGRHRPGITMPEYWAGGVASRADILDGDSSAQMNALWRYLSLGTSARIPDGIDAAHARLAVTDVVRTYRGRSRIAGYRGIAVGFPGGLNYAFNAKNGTLSGIWRGDFVTANWNGQAAGDFNPAARPLQLAQDVSFLGGLAPDASWPLRPVVTEANPVDPDPLYPRNHGYAFGGYHFDDAFVPTFMYRSGDVRIEDRVAPQGGGAAVLVRTLELSAPGPRTLWFRVLTGAIVPAAPVFEVPGLRLRVADARTVLRDFGADGDQELLLEITLPEGRSTVTLHYELLE